LFICKKRNFIDVFFILENVETVIKSSMIIDLTYNFENSKQKGWSYSNSVTATFEQEHDKYSFIEKLTSSMLDKEGFIIDGNITVQITMSWINVCF
jgi:hypothetical protein